VSAVTGQAVWTGTKVEMRDPVVFVAQIRRAKFGTGQALTVRVEPEDEAWRYSDLKHLFGHVYQPVVDYSGYTKVELHEMAKALHMPEGKTSLTQLNREELKDYTAAVEQWLREECGDAYALMDR
jgi:hypothetical protein